MRNGYNMDDKSKSFVETYRAFIDLSDRILSKIIQRLKNNPISNKIKIFHSKFPTYSVLLFLLIFWFVFSGEDNNTEELKARLTHSEKQKQMSEDKLRDATYQIKSKNGELEKLRDTTNQAISKNRELEKLNSQIKSTQRDATGAVEQDRIDKIKAEEQKLAAKKIADLEAEILRLHDRNNWSSKDNQFMNAADCYFEKLVDPKASETEKAFTVNILRFAIRGLDSDFEKIKAAIDQSFSKALDFGRTERVPFSVKPCVEKAELYYKIFKIAQANEEGKEALDTLLKAIFYNINNWDYWAHAANLYLKDWDSKAVYSPERAALYGKMAVSLNPREPFAYWGLANAYIVLKKYKESERIISKALEFSKFEDATYSNWKGDLGRANFTALKGKSLLLSRDYAGAREYLQTALTLNPKITWARSILDEALAPLRKVAQKIYIDDKEDFGLHLEVRNQTIVVKDVSENSYAESSGIKANDLILKVDGLSPFDHEQREHVSFNITNVAKGSKYSTLLEIKRGVDIFYILIEKKV